MALLVSILALPDLAATPTAAERVAIYAQMQVSEVWHPDPEVIVLGVSDKEERASSDAIVLFNGADLLSWESVAGGAATWAVREGAVPVRLQDHGNDIRFRNVWVREL